LNALLSQMLSKHNLRDVIEILELYEQELHVLFAAYLDYGNNEAENGTRIYCYTSKGGLFPTAFIPSGVDAHQSNADTERIPKTISELLEKVNVYFNTSPSKLKMKKELQGR